MIDFIGGCFIGWYGIGYGLIAVIFFIVAMIFLVVWLAQQISKEGKSKK